MKKQDQAARIAEKIRAWWVGKGCVEPSAKLGEFSEKAIRRAITAAVRKERERCVKCVWNKSEPIGSRKIREIDRQSVCEDIIEAIRKGKA